MGRMMTKRLFCNVVFAGEVDAWRKPLFVVLLIFGMNSRGPSTQLDPQLLEQ